MIETLVLTLAIVAISMLFLCVKVLLKPKGEFASQHVSDNPALRKQRIHCVMKQDKEERNRRKLELEK